MDTPPRLRHRRCAVGLLAAVLGVFHFAAEAPAQLDDADSLYGIHWYSDSDPGASQYAGATDAEAMASGRQLWVMEITHVDASSPAGQANLWDQPAWFNGFGAGGHAARVTGNAKGHSLLFRMQPNWGRNVPYFEADASPNNDPFTTANYAAAAAAAATTLQPYVRVWQIGNEVNLDSVENRRWNAASNAYDIVWQPSPVQYAVTYLAVRDALHTVVPGTTPATQIALMQPNSPGLAGNPSIRFIDGVEYLWRQIEAVPPEERGRIDGFALHGYAEPGGSNDGVDGFMESIREQLMVIDQLGLHDRPVFITEFNKHMPDAANAAIGARFVQKAYAALNTWNNGSGGEISGVANHNIVAASWFVFYNAGGGWGDYSLQEKKAQVVSTSSDVNPWYGFQAAAGQNYPAGSLAGGGAWPRDALWWRDEFDTLDATAPLPHWDATASGGSLIANGNGQLLLRSISSNGRAKLLSTGYVFGDFNLFAEFEVADGRRPAAALPTADSFFDIGLRDGSGGYSLTFYTDDAPASKRNRVMLRRTANGATISSFSEEIGVASGDRFQVIVSAQPDGLEISIAKRGASPAALHWTVADTEARVGWIRLENRNVREIALDFLRLGGPEWSVDNPHFDAWLHY